MLQLEFTEEIIGRLNNERYNHPHPRVRRKMSVLYLKSQGIAHKDIKRIERICENTLLSYFREYEKGGIEKLKEVRFRSPQSDLESYTQVIEAYFRKHPPATVNEAVAKIEKLTGIRKGREQVRVFLQKIGMKPRKIGMIPAKADAEAQQKFTVEELEPRIEEARAGKRSLFLPMRHTLS